MALLALIAGGVGLATACTEAAQQAPPTTAPPTTAPTTTVPPTTTTVPTPTVPPTTVTPTTTTVPPTTAVPSTTAPVLAGELDWEVVNTHPHDTSAFTQGLLWSDGLVYESTGLYGQSELRAVEPGDGTVVRETAGDPSHFGEGLALADDRLIWLTWKAGTATVHDRDTLAQVGSFDYDGQGWGLCHDGDRLVMSDGSSTLTFRNPDTFAVTGSVEVTDTDGAPLEQINELECVGDDVWANVWLTDRIVVIDPDTGDVTAEADMAGIISPHPADTDTDAVLNGIAYRPETGTFLITGKRWPTIFEVRFN